MTRLSQPVPQAYRKNECDERVVLKLSADRESMGARMADHPKMPPTHSVRSLWFRAFLESLVALILCLAFVSFWVLRNEMKEFRATQRLFPTTCTSLHDGKSLIAIVNTRVPFESPQKSYLVKYDFAMDRPPTRLDIPIANPVCIHVSSNAAKLFVGDAEGALYSADLNEKKSPAVLRESVIGGYPLDLASSQDGKTLVTLDLTGLYAWNVESGEQRQGHERWHYASGPVSCFAIHPDSKTGICCRTNQGQIELAEFSIQTGEIQSIIERMPSLAEKLAISRDGQFLVASLQSGEILLFHRPLSSAVWTRYVIPGLRTGGSFIARFSPNASMLVTSNIEGDRLVVWNLAEQTMQQEFDVHYRDNGMFGCEFLDDNRLVSWGPDNILHVWDLRSTSSVREVELQL